MKKGISRWSLPAELSLEECLRRAKDAGFDGLELSFDGEGDLGFTTTADDARAIRRKADAIGIDLVGMFFLPEGEVVPYDMEYDRARDAIGASQTKAGPPPLQGGPVFLSSEKISRSKGLF